MFGNGDLKASPCSQRPVTWFNLSCSSSLPWNPAPCPDLEVSSFSGIPGGFFSRGFGKSRRSGLRLLPGSSQRDSESKLWLSESGCLISWKLKVSLSNSKEKCLKQYLDIVITQCVTRRRQRRPAG